MVSPQPEYSFFGWCFILVGVSWVPRTVTFQCRVCDENIEIITDPRQIAALRLAG